MPNEPGSKYERAIRRVVSGIQVLIYRREGNPIRDREEVSIDLARRLQELDRYRGADHSVEWRKQLLELAAYAVFAATQDEHNG